LTSSLRPHELVKEVIPDLGLSEGRPHIALHLIGQFLVELYFEHFSVMLLATLGFSIFGSICTHVRYSRAEARETQASTG
jgi:hypothetical protein